ncbi:MAG: thioredoxin family protein [Candidatus Micrarchaeia archaeon]
MECKQQPLYVFSLVLLVCAAILSGAIWFSINSLSSSVSAVEQTILAKNFAINVNGSVQGKTNNTVAPTPTQPTPSQPTPTPTAKITDVKTVDGNFKQTTEAVCKNGSAVIVRMFTTTWCPHCVWEKPVMKAVTSTFGDKVDLRIYDVDVQGQTPASEEAIWAKYNPGGSIPTLVIGCKYYKIGSGESIGEDTEKAAIRKIICEELGTDAPSFC